MNLAPRIARAAWKTTDDVMPLLTNDPLTQLAFSIYENEGVFALLLGSGMSRAAAIPTGWEITLDLIRRVALAQGVEEQADWAQWYRDQTQEEPDYSSLLEELGSSPDERRSILHSYIEPTDQDREEGLKVPTAAHRAIAALVQSGYWPAPGSEDTELGVLMELEVRHGEASVYA
jgi:hypothetical protein